MFMDKRSQKSLLSFYQKEWIVKNIYPIKIETKALKKRVYK